MHCSGHLHARSTAQLACLTLLSNGIKRSPWVCDPAASQQTEHHARRRQFPRYFECCDLASRANSSVNFPVLHFSNLLAGYILLAFGYSASGHRPTVLVLQQTLFFIFTRLTFVSVRLDSFAPHINNGFEQRAEGPAHQGVSYLH